MNAGNPIPEISKDTYQEGVMPVQSFTTRAIPIVPGMVLEPRLGRPNRSRVELPHGDEASRTSKPIETGQ